MSDTDVGAGAPEFPRLKDGGPTFPRNSADGFVIEPGISLRDYFAAKALQGLIAGASAGVSATARQRGRDVVDIAAHSAYEFADAMIAARGA